MTIHESHTDPWRVTVVDTGLNTMTGGRIKKIQKYVGNEPFMMTYGDGVCDVDISKLVKFHKGHGKIATLTAVMLEQQKEFLILVGIMRLNHLEKRIFQMEHRLMQAIWFWNLRYLI